MGQGGGQQGEQAEGKRAWRTCLDVEAVSQRLGKEWPHQTEESTGGVSSRAVEPCILRSGDLSPWPLIAKW